MRPETKAMIERITDVFTGADGGGEYVMFRALVENLDDRAAKGDEYAEEALTVSLRHFYNLITLSTKLEGNENDSTRKNRRNKKTPRKT